ncbi:MAG: hypothetical protein QOF03_1674, partial [Alphaproteobacteria bacterium]|nr:hypothetical protein [Alphaproteobacteria bacterium]
MSDALSSMEPLERPSPFDLPSKSEGTLLRGDDYFRNVLDDLP